MTATTKTTTKRYKPAKYINSPESIVFVKRNILFGQHHAKEYIVNHYKNHITNTKQAQNQEHAPSLLPVLVVEGYMDAISLWDVGIHHVVATMGTAVSSEQLNLACSTVTGVTSSVGRIILCLDNDTAGISATERLCRNGMIADCITNNSVTMFIATLPNGIKDPAEFIEVQRKNGLNGSNAADAFRTTVINSAVDWREWLIQQIISGYDQDLTSGTTIGRFSNMFERIADFLATTFNPAERTKRAYQIAGQLSSVLANECNVSESSTAVRIQLESDLIDLSARIASAKDAIQRRVDTTFMVSPSMSVPPTKTLASLVRGYGPNSFDQQLNKLAKNATKAKSVLARPNREVQRIHPPNHSKIDVSNIDTKDRTIRIPQNNKVQSSVTPGRKVKTTRAKINRKHDAISVTTHFSGFRFTHQSDIDWLQLDDDKKNGKRNALVLGQRHQRTFYNSDEIGTSNKSGNKLVYFDSANFNGHQYLTSSAFDAGYTSRTNKPDTSSIENGLATIVEQDVESMLISAEDKLLNILLHDGSARTIVKNMLAARQAVNVGDEIQWSCDDKKWLFEQLLGDLNLSPELSSNREMMRSYFAQLPHVPPRAFSKDIDSSFAHEALLLPKDADAHDSLPIDVGISVINPIVDSSFALDIDLAGGESTATSPPSGTLDIFFADETLSALSMSDNLLVGNRHDLAAQEAIATLLWASTALKAKQIRKEIKSYTDTVDSFDTRNVLNTNTDEEDGERNNLLSSSDEQGLKLEIQGNPHLDTYQLDLLLQLRETSFALQSLKESTSRTATRLLDESSSNRVEGGISHALQTNLATQLDDHVRDMWQNPLISEPGINDEPYENELERMATEWGEWYDDDYKWSPGESSKVNSDVLAEFPPDYAEANTDTESLDDFFERINREWGDWVD